MEELGMYVEAISPPRTVRRCIVCGFHEVRTDEVVDRGLVLLSECPRCEHRATTRIAWRPGPEAGIGGAGRCGEPGFAPAEWRPHRLRVVRGEDPRAA